MKQKDYYTFKEILLGLRCEYQNIQRNLNELKNNIIIDTSGINDYYFQIINEKVVLIIDDEKRRSKINFYKDMYSRFVFDQEYNRKIKVTNNNTFAKNLEVVLNSKFYNELEHFFIYNRDKELLKLSIYPQLMILVVGFFDEKYIYYEPREDIIKVGSIKNFIFRDDFHSLLQTKIPIQLLNSYHQSILENNLFNKNIIIPKIVINKSNLTFNENNDNLILKKQRKI